MGNFRDNRGGGGGRNFGPRRDFNDRGPRQMFQATCASCGKECQVPFRPSGERPVYCSDCFEKQGGNEQRRSFGSDRGPRPPFRPQEHDHGHPPPPPHKHEFEALNAKLDQILQLLSPKTAKVEKIHAQTEPIEKKKRVSKKKVEAAAQTPTKVVEAPVEEAQNEPIPTPEPTEAPQE